MSSDWMPGCGSTEGSSSFSFCSKRYPFVRSVTAYQRAASQVSVEFSFTGTVAAGKEISISGLQVNPQQTLHQTLNQALNPQPQTRARTWLTRLMWSSRKVGTSLTFWASGRR